MPREVFELIVEDGLENGERAIIFLDRINRAQSHAPCRWNWSDQPLRRTAAAAQWKLQPWLHQPGENARLEGGQMDSKPGDRLQEVVEIGVRFLDNVIEVNDYPISAIRDMTYANRKIALVWWALADLLHAPCVPYNSDEGGRARPGDHAFYPNQGSRRFLTARRRAGILPELGGPASFEKSAGQCAMPQ